MVKKKIEETKKKIEETKKKTPDKARIIRVNKICNVYSYEYAEKQEVKTK